jgi:hypothetical protein
MITCHLRYTIDPYQLAAFEAYARVWPAIVTRLGGTHHGYFLPGEGANNIALALFSFPSLTAYEQYRTAMLNDPEAQAAITEAERNRCIVSYERSFFRPLTP